MDSVTQSHEVEDRGYSPVHTCENNPKETLNHSKNLKTRNNTEAYNHINCLITSNLFIFD